ncbi:MAG: hypothetical protein NT002_00600 [candidate division Zixibacteria bacterium]|nr:hypothetical protein [candidate division Zixibacteria bacterium]
MRIIIALLTALAINLFMIALASIACAEGEIQNSISISAVPRLPIPSEIPQKVPIEAAEMKEPANLGFDQVASASPGMQIGLTTYDQQSNCRMNRQVDWRATQMVHFTWMKQLNRILWGDRRTAYEAWDPVQGRLIHAGSDEGGGCCIHPLSDYSGYAALDVDTEGKTVIGNHHRSSWNDAMVATVSYDYLPASCYFSAYRSRIPDSLLSYFFDPEGDYLYQWPSMEYQVWNGDTVTHVFAQQFNGGDPGFIVYFRRHGSDIAGTWDYPPKMIDTVSNGISQTVTASRVSGKVALVWTANLPAIPGGYESVDRDRQQDNDIYYMLSNNLGATWDEKQNITKSDSSKSGWRAGNDLSCLIDTGDKLHVIWDAREYSPANGGTFPHFFGSRLYHWGEQFPSQISLIKDANWDLPEYGCFGGAWNTMSIVKMQISECDGKLYALFVQFNDIFNGKNDDCHQSNWTANNSSGTANGELYVAISNDEGRKWDISRNLTNTYTPHCDTIGAVMCESDMWPAMSRFGMDAAGGNFAGVPIVDPSGSYSGTNYLDVFYVNDRYPGSCPQDEGVWTTNPVKWFRLPCVDPIPNPILSFTPKEFAFPTWVKPGHQLDTLVRLENLGNADIVFSSITAIRITGTAYDWLGVASAPTTIPYTEPSYCYMNVQLNKGGVVTSSPFGFDGIIVFNGNFLGSPDTLKIHLVIADSVQFPEWASIRTSCKKISLSNSGNLGRSGENLGNNLDFFNDCDITNNLIGEDDNARIYGRL